MASLGGSAAPGAYRPPRTWRVITICGSAATMGSMNQASGGKEQHKSPGRGPRHVPRSKKPCPRFKEVARAARGSPAAGRSRPPYRCPHPPAQGCPATYPPSAPAYEAPATPLKPLPAAPVDLDAFRIRRRDLAGGVIHEYAQVA
jgi:hypothetical protein